MHLGGIQEIQVDVRILAATNVDLRKEVREGPFPARNLFYRLKRSSTGRSAPACAPAAKTFPCSPITSSTSTPTRTALQRAALSADAPARPRRLRVARQRPRARKFNLNAESCSPSGPIIGFPTCSPATFTGRSFQDALLEHNPNASLFDILEVIEKRINHREIRALQLETRPDAGRAVPHPALHSQPKNQAPNVEIRKKGRRVERGNGFQGLRKSRVAPPSARLCFCCLRWE